MDLNLKLWALGAYFAVGALHCVAFFRRERGVRSDDWAALHWGWSVGFVVVCELLWPVIPIMALVDGYYALFSRSKWAEEKRWEAWPLGDHGKKRYESHEHLMASLNAARRSTEDQTRLLGEANSLIDSLRGQLGRLAPNDEFICQSCWDRLNGALLYGLIPWTRCTPLNAHCTKCKCELPKAAYHYPGDQMMGTLGAVGDVIRLDRATRTKGDDDGNHDH